MMMTLRKISVGLFFAYLLLLLTPCLAQTVPDPFLRVGGTSNPPIIDGNLNDAAWTQGVDVGDFSITGSSKPASEATEVRFTYDDQGLYVAWRCEETLLYAAKHRESEIRVNATHLDDDVLDDDSVELFLQSSSDVLEFDVNSIGTLYDAKSQRSDLWGTRDASWNSGAVAAGRQEDGYWTAELAIPWSAFGVSHAPAPATYWNFALARNAKARSEVSSWTQNTSTAIHRMTNFGRMRYELSVPNVMPLGVPEFNAGESTFSVLLSEADTINVFLTDDSGTHPFSKTATGPGTVNLPISTNTTGDTVQFRWDAAVGSMHYYISPQLTLDAQNPPPPPTEPPPPAPVNPPPPPPQVDPSSPGADTSAPPVVDPAKSLFLRVGAASSAPVIDGNLNDAAWTQGVSIGDFAITGSSRPASQGTQVRFVYGTQGLYVGWRCEESLLSVVGQQQSEVRSNATTLDGDVLNDDSVEVFLKRSSDVLEFDVNSIGTLYDAKSQLSDLWGTRDASWNSGAQVVSKQEDGYWTSEMLIPWSAFGISAPPAPATYWSFALARNAAGRGEVSSWTQNTSTAMHGMTKFANMRFEQTVPNVESQGLPVFNAGQSTYSVQVSEADTIDVDLTGESGAQHFTKTASGAGTVNLPISTTDSSVQFQWDATDGVRTYYRSPQLTLDSHSPFAHLTISATSDWKLYVNGALFTQGSAVQNKVIAIPVGDGINDLVVQTQNGQATLDLQQPGFTPDGTISWHTHSVDPSVLSGTDRSAWNIAANHNGLIGTAGSPAYLQYTVLSNSTPSYPKESPAFYIAQGSAQQITFLAEGVNGVPLNNWQMTVAVPSQFEVLGSSGLYAYSVSGKPKFTTTSIGTTTINGTAMKLYRVTADHSIVYTANQSTDLTGFEVLFRFPTSATLDTSKLYNFYYWTSANGGTVSEAPQTIAVRTLSALTGMQPTKFVWELWTGNARSPQYDNSTLLLNILDTAKQAGFNRYQSSDDASFNSTLNSYGLDPFLTINFADGRTFDITKPYLAAHPTDGLVDKNGVRSDKYMCTTQLLGANWSMFQQSIKSVAQNSGASDIEYDYENDPFSSPHACFDSRCLAAFRTFAHISSSVTLTPAKVQSTYASQWNDFMASRAATLLKKMKDAVHSGKSTTHFVAYSGYQSSYTKTHYGIDWNLIGQNQSVDEAAMGYGRSATSIADSKSALGAIPVTFGELLSPYSKHSIDPVPPLLRSTMLRRALDATAGVLIYMRPSMDGRSWKAVADVSRLTADYETLFLTKTLQSVSGQDPTSVQIATGGGKTILCVMNLSASQNSSFNFQVPSSLGQGRDFFTGAHINGGQTLNITLAPGDAKAYVF